MRPSAASVRAVAASGTSNLKLSDLLEDDSSSSRICPAELLFRSGPRVCALSGRLRRRIGRTLLTAGAGPHDETDDNHRRNNTRGGNARGPFRTIDLPLSSRTGSGQWRI